MHPLQQRLFVCGLEERTQYQARGISHLVTVASPNAGSSRPSWFHGAHLDLRFGDVTSEADALRYRTAAPSIADIESAVNFVRQAWAGTDARILVSCDYGASRSPALAYLFAADELGRGHEAEALGLVLAIRPGAVPNGMVVRLGDTLMKRDGALTAPLKDLYARINTELFRKGV